MNRILYTFIAAAMTAALLCGCSDDNSKNENTDESSSVAETTTDAATAAASDDQNDSGYDDDAQEETTAEPENHELQRDIEPAEGTYVYDYAGLLSSDDFDECNNYAEWLYENYLINAAVVTTDDIEELTPEQYAEDVYVKLYEGRGSGLLLLINNDTNQDILYKTGSCLTFISEETESEEFYWATQEIIGGDYKSAILRLMQLGENCPQHIFDNGGILTSEQITSLESLCADSSTAISVLATSNSTSSTNEEICRSYYDRHYQDSVGIMIMLDTATNTITVVSDGDLPSTLDTTLTEADTLAASGDYSGALSNVITVLKG